MGLNSGAAVSVANVSNVEKFYLQSTADTLAIDFTKTNAETHVYNYNSSGASSFTGISSANVELGVIGGAAGKTQTFAFDATNTAAAATLVVNGAAGTAAITDHAAVKTVTVKAQGTASTMAGLTLGNSVTKLNLEGAVKLDIKATNLAATVTEINASASTGGVLVQQDQALNQKFTGGTGNDTFIAGAAGTNITKDDSIDGGDGQDTFTIKTAVSTAGATAGIKNFEILGLDGTTGNITQDMDLFPYTTVAVSANACSHVLNNVLNNTTINFNGDVTDFTPTLKTNTATDAMTFNVGGTAGGVTVTKVSPDVRLETLTFNSQGTAANTITEIGTAVGNVAFTGATGLTLTKVSNVTGVLDFSKMTSAVTIGNLAGAVTNAGSVSNQTITTTDLGDTIYVQNTSASDDSGTANTGVLINAGAGNDTVTVDAKAKLTTSTIDLGAGNDVLTIGNNTNVQSLTIKDGAGFDKLTLGTAAATDTKNLQISATNSNDGLWVAEAVNSQAAGAGTNISFKGALANGTGTTSAAASVATDASSGTSIGTDLAGVISTNSNATVFIIQRNLTGDAATAVTNAATWVDAATAMARADLVEAALATAIGTVTGLDSALGTSDKVLMAFDNGTHSVLAYVTNTDTTVANTLTAAEIQVVGVFANTAALVATQDFIA